MSAAPIILVHLRRPRNEANESRTDPFWEFGSFGCTGCHHGNLLHPRRIDEVVEARLGFIQGGHDGFRLVHLTPPIKIVIHDDRCEALWKPSRMPFRYDSAPILIRNDGVTDFPLFKRAIAHVDRSTWEARLSSAFRTRRTPLPRAIARQIASVFDARRGVASRSAIATEYWHALPNPPRNVDQNRKKAYADLRRQLGSPLLNEGKPRCAPRRKRRC